MSRLFRFFAASSTSLLLLLFVYFGTGCQERRPTLLNAAVTDAGGGPKDVTPMINASLKRLGSRPGDILVMSPGEIRATIHLGVGQALRFGPGQWTCSASPCISMDHGAQVLGAGVFRTRLQLAENSIGPLIQSRNYLTLARLPEETARHGKFSLAGDRKVMPGTKYLRIKDLTLDGQKDRQSQVSNGVEIFGYWFWIEDLAIERFKGDGLVTQFIAAADVSSADNDLMESYISRIKMLSNEGNGWTFKGPHDSIASGIVSANNGGWGIDVQHKEGHYSGGGLMLTNTHLYGNANGMRTESGANILAFGLESEANKGVGLLLRSNDSVVQGTFYANGEYGVQFGDGASYAGANVLNVQIHNNKKAQIYWFASAGYNMVTGSIFPNDAAQKYFELKPTRFDQVLTSGPDAVQRFSGGIEFDSSQNVYGAKLYKPVEHKANRGVAPKGAIAAFAK